MIFFRNNDVLHGKVINTQIGINTAYGFVQVPLDTCAGISFEGARANTEALITVNRNRLTGIVTDRIIKFSIGSSGTPIKLRKEKIRFILFKVRAQEGKNSSYSGKSNLFVMTNGDLLTGNTVENSFEIGTDYADIPVTFAEAKTIQMQGGDNVTAVIKKKNGDVMRGSLKTEELSIDLDIGITVDAVYKDKFAKIFVDNGYSQLDTSFGSLQPVSGESDGALSGGTGEETIKNTLGMTFKYIPPGSFMMGSPRNEFNRSDNEVQHKVTLTKGFYMQTTEVTQAQWYAVMGNNPSKFSQCGGDCPVESVSWDDIQQFLDALSKKEPGRHYRLPTEAEWEYAARAATATAYGFGDDNALLRYYAWYTDNSGDKTHPVGQKKPNKWGLYDMHGNVYEWCQDWFGNYPPGEVTDPKGANSGSERVLRGGSWISSARNCRSADRLSLPDLRYSCSGFRLVLLPGQ